MWQAKFFPQYSEICTWVNGKLLPSLNLPEGLPSKISSLTAWDWMKDLGLQYSRWRKGYVDGHKRPDVVVDHHKYVEKMRELENSHNPPPNCSDGSNPYPLGDASQPNPFVIIYNDETTFHTNDELRTGWHEKEK